MGFYTVLLVTHTILVLFLIVMVLIQRTDSDGLSGLSGGGGNQFMTGRGQANFMTRTTAILAAAFMITSLALATMANHMTGKSIIDTVPVEGAATVGENTIDKTNAETTTGNDSIESPKVQTEKKIRTSSS